MQIISEDYRELNRKLHADSTAYGTSGASYAPQVMQLCRQMKAETVLDHGAGKGTLAAVLRANGIECAEYDPAVEGKASLPEPADLVVSTDVIEHVEPEYVEAYLDEVQRLTKKTAMLVVATRPAKKTLPDGRNAHISNHSVEWWLPKLRERFTMQLLIAEETHFTFIGVPK